MKRLLALAAAAALAACSGAKLEKQRRTIEELETKAGSLLAQLKDRADEAEGLKASKAELEGRLVELEGKLAAAEGRIATLTKSNKDLSDAIGASKDELGARLNAIVAEKDEAARRLAEAIKEKLSLERLKSLYQSARDKAGRELGRLGQELARLREERDALSSRVAGVEAQGRAADETREARRAKAREEMKAAAESLLPELQSGAARVDQDGESFSVTFTAESIFDEGSAKVQERASGALARLGAALKGLPDKAVRVEAHSDDSPYKKGLIGGYDGHWELSAARATAVARWLRERAGLDAARLSAVGFGEHRPVKPNYSSEGRAANRRVAIVVSPADSAP